jgi:DNA-binding MarR family transcriptional regulator
MKPKKLGRMVLKEEFFIITKCLEEAMILNQMCYWSERMKDIDKFLEEEYTMLVDHVPVLSHGWIYKSASELVEEMFGAISEKTMNRVLDRLVKKNFLRRRMNPNPRYKFDKTYHYRVNFVEIITQLTSKNMPLSGYAIIEECAERISQGVAPKRHFDGSEDHSDGAITETITETTDKEINPIIPSKPKLTKVGVQKPIAVSEQVWNDFIALRKAKRAPLSQTALAGILNEADKALMTLEDALTECVTRGWQSFKAEWMKPKTTTKPERFSNI